MTASKIEWTDRSDWNPIRGCTRVSPGCGGPGPAGGCYAEAMAARFSDPGQWGHGFAERTSKGGRWTGLVAIQWDRLELPLRWTRPANIFASSTSDFFHAALDQGDVAQLFGVMIAAHHLRGHTFQILTKRSDRMRQFLNDPDFWEVANASAEAYIMERVDPLDRRSDDARATCGDYGPHDPPPGIWLGVSVEDQQRADERIPYLLATPAAVRFISAEPLLGPVTLGNYEDPSYLHDWLTGHWQEVDSAPDGGMAKGQGSGIDWVIVGGESGPGARPMHPDWARSLRDQCQAAGVAFHFKQWGEWFPFGEQDAEGNVNTVTRGEKPGHWHEWGHDHGFACRIGKKAAGRLLDGREWNEVPHG